MKKIILMAALLLAGLVSFSQISKVVKFRTSQTSSRQRSVIDSSWGGWTDIGIGGALVIFGDTYFKIYGRFTQTYSIVSTEDVVNKAAYSCAIFHCVTDYGWDCIITVTSYYAKNIKDRFDIDLDGVQLTMRLTKEK